MMRCWEECDKENMVDESGAMKETDAGRGRGRRLGM